MNKQHGRLRKTNPPRGAPIKYTVRYRQTMRSTMSATCSAGRHQHKVLMCAQVVKANVLIKKSLLDPSFKLDPVSKDPGCSSSCFDS